MRTVLTLLFLPLLAHGQAPPPSVTPAWDIAPVIADFAAQAARAKPILDQVNPQEWVANGAPEVYVAQYRSAQQELGYVANAAKAFERQPDKLTLALDAYFRWQALETRLSTLADGVRRYQNPAIGDLLVSVVGENSSSRDRLREYIGELASQEEQQLAVVDQEAQRCRGNLTRTPARPAPVKKAAPPKPEGKQE